MVLSEEELHRNLETLKALDKVLKEGPWDETLFLRGIGKKLKDARERFIKDSGLEDQVIQSLHPPMATQAAADLQSVEVYVSLYQAEGANIRKWEAILSSLPALSISRPIYKNEADIQTAFRTKAYKINDAYAVVKLHQADILKPKDDKPPIDRYGCELLVLREGAVQVKDIIRFVHVSGEYQFRNGMLVK